MKINSITPNYSAKNHISNNYNNRQHSPNFKADYSDKPVPPAGKAVAAASAIALLTGTIYHGINEFGHKDEPQQQGTEFIFNPVQEYEDENLTEVDVETFRKSIKKEQERIAVNDTTDTIHNDSIFVPDTIPHKKDPEIGHFHGHAYEIIPKGDTVVLVPVQTPKANDLKKSKSDSLDMD